MMPSSRHPLTLTTNVPHGNSLLDAILHESVDEVPRRCTDGRSDEEREPGAVRHGDVRPQSVVATTCRRGVRRAATMPA